MEGFNTGEVLEIDKPKVSPIIKVNELKAKKKESYSDTMYEYLTTTLEFTEQTKVQKVKEGLLVQREDGDYIVRVIKKKERVLPYGK